MSVTHANCPCCSCVESGCCSNCTTCTACGSGYDIDLYISSTSQSGSISGSRSLQACVSNCTTCTKVDPNGCVRARVFNNTGSTIAVQFNFTVSGLSGSCVVHGNYNCGSSEADYSNGGPQNWFAFIVADGSYATATMDHYIKNTGCCGTSATIDTFTYSTSVYAPAGFCCDGNPGTGTNPGCTSSLTNLDTFEFCATYGGDCTMVINVGTCSTQPCVSCTSGFAAYIVTSVYCNGIVCQFDADFSCCVP